MPVLSALQTRDYLVVRVRATAGAAAAERSADIRFLIDTSDSMSGERLHSVMRTLAAARELFRAGDHLTLVGFGEAATTYASRLEATPEGLDTFYRAVEAMHTTGCTNLSAGLERLLELGEGAPPADAVVLLTDGQVNRGITSTVGLRTMALSVARDAPLHTLGYGADHNRVLLRDLATKTHGSYTYVDSEEILPTAMGDLVAGCRMEVLRGAALRVPAGWICQELAGPVIGSIVPDRDYWVVFKAAEGATPDSGPIVLTGGGGIEVASLPNSPIGSELASSEQVLRCRVAALLSEASDALETQRVATVQPGLEAMRTELAGLDESLRGRPMVVRMTAQIEETLEAVRLAISRPAYAAADAALLARVSSGATAYCTQRGGYSAAPGDPDDHDNLFSSPAQRMASNTTRVRYGNTPVPGMPPAAPARLGRMPGSLTMMTGMGTPPDGSPTHAMSPYMSSRVGAMAPPPLYDLNEDDVGTPAPPLPQSLTPAPTS
jgi:hypothetical protein